MAYTVNKLAKLSGVSVRTLHFYDEIGLLKPAYVGENHYRYYEEEQLLMLQQILFYRELNLPLAEIQRIVNDSDFNKVEALLSHQRQLEETLGRTNQMIQTIEKTLAHLRGNTPMKLEEIFHGFDAEKQKLYEDFLVDYGVDPKVLNEARQKLTHWKKDEWLEHKREADALYAELAATIKEGLSPSSPKVQRLIKQHYEMTTLFWTPTQETYLGLSELYSSHPDFVKFYDDIHPELLNFLKAAMKVFAEKELD